METLDAIKNIAESAYAKAIAEGETNSKDAFLAILITISKAGQAYAPTENKEGKISMPQRVHQRIVNNKDVSVIAYALSELGHRSLFPSGAYNQTETIRKAAELLNVKPHTLKNMRDTFDSHTRSHRVGWKIPLNAIQQEVFNEMRAKSREEVDETISKILNQ